MSKAHQRYSCIFHIYCKFLNKSNPNISFLIAFDHSFSFLVLNIKTLLINVNVYMFPYQCEPFMGKYENKCMLLML